MAFAEGDIDNDGRFEPLAADMQPYRSGADVDAGPGDRCCRRTPDAYYGGTARTYANTLQVRDAAGAFRTRVAGVGVDATGGRRSPLRRSGLRRRPRPVHGHRHGGRGVRPPARGRSSAVDGLANGNAGGQARFGCCRGAGRDPGTPLRRQSPGSAAAPPRECQAPSLGGRRPPRSLSRAYGTRGTRGKDHRQSF